VFDLTLQGAALASVRLNSAITVLSRSSGQWSDDDCDMLGNGIVVGRILFSSGAPQERPWM
jgi:hypothetical protein